MSPKPDPTNGCNLGATGKLVRGAFTSLKAPATFRETLRTRLVHEALPGGPADGAFAGQSSVSGTRAGAARAARGT